MGLFSTPQTQSVDPVELARQQVRAREQENLIGRASLNPTQTIGLLYGQAGRSLGRAIEKLSGYEDPLITQAKKQKQMDSMFTARDKFLITEATRLGIPIGGSEFYNLARRISPQFNLPGTDVTKHQLLNADAVTKVDTNDTNRRTKNQYRGLQKFIATKQPQAQQQPVDTQTQEVIPNPEVVMQEFKTQLNRPLSELEKKRGATLTYDEYQSFTRKQKEAFDADIGNEGALRFIEDGMAGRNQGVSIPAVESPVQRDKVVKQETPARQDQASKISPFVKTDHYSKRITARKADIGKLEQRIAQINDYNPAGATADFQTLKSEDVQKLQNKIKALEDENQEDEKAIRELNKENQVINVNGQAFLINKITGDQTPINVPPAYEQLDNGLFFTRRPKEVNGKVEHAGVYLEAVKENGKIKYRELSSKEVRALQKEGVLTEEEKIEAASKLEYATKFLPKHFEDMQQVQAAQLAVNKASALLDDGIYTGAGAEYQLNLQRFAKAFEFVLPSGFNEMQKTINKEKVANTQQYQAVLGVLVGQVIRAFGAGTGLSDADREFARAMVGQDITLSEDALRGLMLFHSNSLQRKFNNYDNAINLYNKEGFTYKRYKLAPITPYEAEKKMDVNKFKAFERKLQYDLEDTTRFDQDYQAFGNDFAP